MLATECWLEYATEHYPTYRVTRSPGNEIGSNDRRLLGLTGNIPGDH